MLGQGVGLVWFWDYCSLNALRALPYLQEWHRRYHERGLKVIGVHSPQFPFARDQDRVQEAVVRLGIEFPVAPDPDYEIWSLYGNEVWPATYLWDRTGVLRFYHFGEGELRPVRGGRAGAAARDRRRCRAPGPDAPVRRTDRPGALVQAPTPHTYLEDGPRGRWSRAATTCRSATRAPTAAAVLEGGRKA